MGDRATALACALFVAGALVTNGWAGTRRHDTADSFHVNLAAAPEYDAVGLITENGSTACTGTLIHPNYVLTAAHCADGNLSILEYRINGQRRTIVDSFTALGWSGDPAEGNDIGILELSAPIEHVTPMRFDRSATSPVGQTITIVGRGQGGTGLTGHVFGTAKKRAGFNVIDQIGGTVDEETLDTNVALIDFDKPGDPSQNAIVTGSPVPLTGEYLVAVHDSGAPWLTADGILAVSSFVVAPLGGAVDSSYGEVGGAMRVIGHQGWIDATAGESTFWTGGTGDWTQGTKWDNRVPIATVGAGIVQDAASDVALLGVQNAGWLFVEDNARLTIQSAGVLNLAESLNARDSGAVHVETEGRLNATNVVLGPTAVTGVGFSGPSATALIDASNSATIAGVLDLNLGSSYVPALGDTAMFITATSTTGAFVGIQGVVQSASLGIAVRYSPTSVDGRVSLRGDTDFDDDVDTLDVTEAIIGFTGAGVGGRTWGEGDNDGDGDVDTADITTGLINFTGASAGNEKKPSLVYDPATGNLSVDASGSAIASFSIVGGPFDAAEANLCNLPSGLIDQVETQVGWVSHDLFGGFNGLVELGAILPTGLNRTGVQALLTSANYGIALGSGGGGGAFAIIIPEPAALSFVMAGVCLVLRRRR